MITVELGISGDAQDLVAAIAPAQQWQRWITRWLEILAPQCSPIGAYELSIQLTTDETIQQLNGQYRGRDRPTDVLSFAASDGIQLPPELLEQIPFNLGDLVISVPAAQRQCVFHGHTATEELAWLAAHGLLHLLGWDHPDEPRLQEMFLMQQTLLAEVGLALGSSEYFVPGRC